MSKTLRMLYASLFLAFCCGVSLGLIRGNVMFSSAYPSFYICGAVFIVLTGVASYFIYASSKSEGRENYNLSNIPSDWSTKYKKHIQVIQLISAFFILMAAVRIIISSASSSLSIIHSLFTFVCGVSIFFRVKSKDAVENTALLSLFAVFYLAFYLLMFYRSTAKYPDVNSFGPQVLTLAFLIISAYLNASSKFTTRASFFRYFITLFSFSLCTGDLTAYILNRQTLSVTEPAVYLPIVCGFSLFYTFSLFVPPLQVINIPPNNTDENIKS